MLSFLLIIVISYPLFVWSAHIYDDKFKNSPKSIKESKNGYGFFNNRIKEAEETENIDILILGSSLAYRLIDTRNFNTYGLKAFNLGSSSQTPLQTEFLIDRYLDQFNPQLIIWDISPSLFSNNGLESYVDLVSNFGFDPSFIQQAITIKKIDAFHTLSFVLIEEFLNGKKEEPLKHKTNREVYIKDGFVETIATEYKRVKPLEQVSLKLIPYQKKSFERILEKLKNRNLILVMAPIRIEDYQFMNGVGEFIEYIDHYTKSMDAISFYNFNELDDSVFSSTNLFYDEFHLNTKGIKIYNKILIDSIFND